MAAVSSLDSDLRKLRLDKYTPGAAREAKNWIEGILGEKLPSGDLLEGLKDGVALCKLVNMAVSPGVKFKQSAMPFVQMENISHFLRVCQMPPLNLQQHDTFLTVDLYEQKDPAQVLQCIGAFSRAANRVAPDRFPTAIGPKKGNGVLSPQSTGPVSPPPLRGRGISNASNASSAFGTPRPPVLAATRTGESASGRWSPTKSPTNGSTSPGVSVSSWSKREHEGATAPAWNIAQYGYMGGASQGNLGIAFGGRRQITSAGPHVPNTAEKERQRKEREAEEERQRQQMEEEQRRRRAELEAEEERARLEEERRWEEETRRAREEERRRAAEEKQRWEEEERQWRITEEKRRKEEEEAEALLAEERRRNRSRSRTRDGPKLRGQYLSQYQAEEEAAGGGHDGADDERGYSSRIKELEKELELARQREQEYEKERQGRSGKKAPAIPPRESSKPRARSRSRANDSRVANVAAANSVPSRQDSWSRDEREFLRTQWSQQQEEPAPTPVPAPQSSGVPAKAPRPLPDPGKVRTHRTGERQPLPQPPQDVIAPAVRSHRTGERQQHDVPAPAIRSHRTGERQDPLPPAIRTHRTGERPEVPVKKHHTGSRPLPDPGAYSSAQPPQQQPPQNRTDRFLAGHAAPQTAPAQQTYAREVVGTAERDAEDRRRAAAQSRTKAGGWASKSLLEREMEMERQRQREWEEAQRETAAKPRPADGGVDGIGGGVGGRWDVGQWSGYTGGDGGNRGNQGIGAGRRQIVGPRPLPGPGR